MYWQLYGVDLDFLHAITNRLRSTSWNNESICKFEYLMFGT